MRPRQGGTISSRTVDDSRARPTFDEHPLADTVLVGTCLIEQRALVDALEEHGEPRVVQG
jgi:hypothetical protein